MADPANTTLAFIEGLGGPEMVMVFVVVLLLFGGHKLPEFARGLGKTMREFKKAASGVEDEFRRALEEDERKKFAPPPPPPAPMTIQAATALSPDEAANAAADEISATEPLTSTTTSQTEQAGIETDDPYADSTTQPAAEPALEPATEPAAEPALEPAADDDAGMERKPKPGAPSDDD